MSKEVEDKLDKIQEDITDIKITLAANTSSLQEHMRRTAIAEDRIELIQSEMNTQLTPIKSHVTMVNTALKVLAALGAILLGLHQLGLIKFS